MSWEWHIAGGRNTRTPGYWIGLDCIRTLFGEPGVFSSPSIAFLSFLSFFNDGLFPLFFFRSTLSDSCVTAPEDSQEAELPHADFLSFVSGVVRDYIFGDRTTERHEGERKLALKLGGPPKNYRNIIWGDKVRGHDDLSIPRAHSNWLG